MLRTGALIAVCSLSAGATPAFADDHEAFLRLLGEPVEQERVRSAAARSAVIVQNPCSEIKFTIEKKFVPYKQPVFDSGGSIGSGSWKQVVDATGCGASRVLNVLVSADGPNNISAMPLLPGTTHADPVLQKDAVGFAVQAIATVAGSKEPNCAVGYVADTAFVEEESSTLEGAKGPSWREIWTLASCTRKMLVPVHFIPDATGTSISAGPGSAVKVLPLT